MKNYYKEDARWDLIPSHMHEGIRNYVMDGVPTGGFLTALLRNAPFSEVVAKADSENQRALLGWAQFIYNEIPALAHGDWARVNGWIKSGGINGQEAARQKEASDA